MATIPGTHPDQMAIPGSDKWLELERIGKKTLDDFFEAINSKDSMRWATTMHYPHLRLGNTKFQQWDTPEEMARDNYLPEKFTWDHTRVDWWKMIQANDEKMHVLLQFARCKEGGETLTAYETLYILTKENGRWGVRARSSFAGILNVNTAF